MPAKKIWVASILLALSGGAQAEGLYIGAKTGLVTVDDSAFDDALNAGVLVGYEVPAEGSLSWAIEAELTTSVSDGDFEAFGVKGDWNIDTQALYGVMKFGDSLYGKIKLGVLREDVSASAGGVSADASDSGLAWGLGGGFRATDYLDVEAEYSQIESDAAFISVGVNYHF